MECLMRDQLREVWFGVRKPQGESSSLRLLGTWKEGFLVRNRALQLRDVLIAYSR